MSGLLGDPYRAREALDHRRPVELDGDVHLQTLGTLRQIAQRERYRVERLDGYPLGTVGTDDELVTAQILHQPRVRRVGSEVGETGIRRAEARHL